jgi:hypothetical protein
MQEDVLAKHFQAMGVRVKFRPLEQRRIRPGGEKPKFIIDIANDRGGEYFDVAVANDAPNFRILQALPKERHLLLYSEDGQRFLCGHDERHWFVAPIADPVSTVRAAKQSLLPPAVWEQVKSLPPGEVDNRRNAVFKRQGEWFFVQTAHRFQNPVIHKNEPLQRTAGSKPHLCEELIREGGQLVYIVGADQYTEEEYRQQKARDPNFVRRGVRTMVSNPDVYVRGYVRHPDHATIQLHEWHRVFINAELTTSHVTFLD